MNTRTRVIVAVIGFTLVSALAWATLSSGTMSTLVGPPTVYEAFDVKRQTPGLWKIRIEAKDGVKVATQTIVFQPGGESGWHSHPGPVLISVKEGTMTFYESDCSSRIVSAGEGFLDVGDHPHLARNESSQQATNVVTYLVPPDAPSLRIDEPQPVTCNVQ